MKNKNQVMAIVLAGVCTYSVSVNYIQTKAISEINEQIMKAQQLFGQSSTFVGRANMTYAFKVKIKRLNEEPFEVPLFQIATGGYEDETASITMYKLQTPKNNWFYRIRVERESGGWSLHPWGSIEHLEDGYGLNEMEIDAIRNLLKDLGGHEELKNGQSLNTFGLSGEEVETTGTIMVEACAGNVFSAEKGPGL